MKTYTGIAVCGKAGAGKTRFAHELVRELKERGYAARHYAFGDSVKDEVQERYGLVKTDPGGREKLIEHGMAMREFDRDHWVRRLADRIDTTPNVLPVICDTRFQNEYDWARRRGMMLVRLDATNLDRAGALYARGEDAALAESTHPSETELDEAAFDLRWWNPHGGVIQLARLAVLTCDVFTGIEAAA